MDSALIQGYYQCFTRLLLIVWLLSVCYLCVYTANMIIQSYVGRY